jgi:GT2 family glycosyltransferase
LVEYNHPFNYQKMNNWAVEQIQAKFILFLNNDTELIPASRGLLEKMYAKAGQKDVGVTGCLLLYGDGSTIQHAGVFLLPGGMADHLYVGKKLSKALKNTGSADFPYSPVESRPMTAVTGAVNIVERAKFLEAGSYNEAFVIGGGDVDLCIRLNKAGLQTWYVAGGYIIHKESQSRSHKPIPYGDFYQSYLSYITAYDTKLGDPFLPKITQGMK